MLQCVVLAGGLGTRMLPLTATAPKAMLEVAGRPFVSHQLELLQSNGIRDVVFCIGTLGEMIRDYVGDGRRWNMDVRYSDDGERLLGTGGALRRAADGGLLREDFLVVYGDSYLPIEFGPVVDAFAVSGAPAMMTVLRNKGRWDTSNAACSDKWVTYYGKGAAPENVSLEWIDYGLGALRREVIETRVPAAETVDLADVYHRLSLEGLLAAYPVERRFYEVGSVEGLRELESFLRARSA
jgi:NDP-sugar pyrophosphorylase family protein